MTLEAPNVTKRRRPSVKIFTTGGAIDKTYTAGRLEVGGPHVQRIVHDGRVRGDHEVEPLCREDNSTAKTGLKPSETTC